MAIANGAVQRVYRIESWERCDEDRRWRFTGSPEDEAGTRYENLDVSSH